MNAEQRHEAVIAWAQEAVSSVDSDTKDEDSATERRVSISLRRDLGTIIHRCQRRLAVLRGDA